MRPLSARWGVLIALASLALTVVIGGNPAATAIPRTAVPPPGMPLQHIIFVLQENQTVDSVLGRWCVTTARCNGAVTGKAGTTVRPLTPAPDIVPQVGHSVSSQAKAVDGGKMDGFYKIPGCTAPNYACYSTATDAEVPNLERLVTNFAISDATFSTAPVMSWEQHLLFGALTLDGFYGDNPVRDPTLSGGTGWGCTSPNQVKWGPQLAWVPPCIPDATGAGPRRVSPVPWVPNLYTDTLVPSGVSYKFYGACYTGGNCFGANNTNENVWDPGSAFWAWRGNSTQVAASARHPQDIISDVTTGNLPNFSFVTPAPVNSQHNTDSLTKGDNWIGQVVSAVENSPYWSTSAVVIGYDDCGCFYDHVVPPANSGWGMRTPLVIVSPYAKAGYTDSTPTSLATSLVALVEYVFGLPALTATSPDNGAYYWSNMFDFSQAPLPPAGLKMSAVPTASQRYLATHPASEEADPDS